MINQHAKFIQLQDRLRATAEAQGDHALGEALSTCIRTLSGEQPNYSACPIRTLLLEDYVQTGQVPQGPQNPASPGLLSSPVPSLPRQAILDRMHALMKRDALRLKDVRYLEALDACDRATTTNPNCPMFKLLHKS